ncbi:hypothetical protein GCM10023189_35510 [Nibrella saemangeumensis]|uniref:Histidine kinase domain-containing protein n=1 Tax=Nibrella saemangeumensis TaxID=1084526 RepID=A0ABP8N2Z6_9BACT
MHSASGSFPKKDPLRSVTSQFEHLSEKDGLSDKSVRCILQDREGFIWIGTIDGLNKYDGNTFTVIQQEPARPDSSLRGTYISDLYEDRSGNLWAATIANNFTGEGGLHLIDKRTGAATRVNIRVKSDEWSRAMDIFEDRQGVLWIGSWGGLIRYEPKTKHAKLYRSPRPKTTVICSLEDEKNRFWVGTVNGLYQFDRQSGRFTLVPYPPDSAGQQPWVSTLFQDKAGRLWAGTNNHGLMRLNPEGQSPGLVRYTAGGQINRHIFMNAIQESPAGQLWLGTTEGLQQVDTRTGEVITHRCNPALPDGLSSDRVSSVYFDRSGTLWLGTYQGINKRIGASPKFTSVQLVPASPVVPPSENHVSALVRDHTGLIWFGSNNRKLYRYDPKTGAITFVPIDPENPGDPAPANRLQTVYEDHSGQMWVSTDSALLRMDRVTGTFVRCSPRITRIQTFAEDKSGSLWLGGEGGVARFTPKDGRFRYYLLDTKTPVDVNSVMVSRTGDIWMAVRGKGITRLNPKTDQFTHYHPVLPAPAGQLNDTQVTGFYEDPDGVIWMGTRSGGLNRFDPPSGRFTALTTRNGLPSNYVASVINDRHGHLWISTTRGICRFNTRTNTFHNYTTDDGLPHNMFLSKVAHGLNGDLLFGSLNGIAMVHTDRFYEDATFPVYITGFSVLDQNRPLPAGRVELPHDENFLSFDFAALTYQSPEKNQYAYQLAGVDKNWVYCGTRHFASYTDLSPGEYTFRVKAANRDGIWNESGTEILVIIHPPWWATWSFRIALTVSLILLAIAGVRYYTHYRLSRQRTEMKRVLQAQEEERQRLAADLHDDLGATLSAIKVQLKARQTNPDRLANPVQLIDKAIRDLRLISHNLMPPEFGKLGLTEVIRETVKRAQASSGLNCMFITYGQEHPLDQETELTIYRIALELINNAIKHAKAGQVTVQLIFYAHQLTLLVEDDGRGYSLTEQQEPIGIGLRNIRSRVAYLNAKLLIDSGQRGTTITVDVPYTKAPKGSPETPFFFPGVSRNNGLN